MSYEFLQTLWFILIAVLWIGFYFLEGFDFGVGMLLPFLGKKDEERRAIINSIGSTWDGNEVWLLTAGGATFAAFPMWYATMFSGFYIALFLLLIGLILRRAGRIRERFSRLVVGGLALVFTSHVCLHVGVMLGLLPLTGLTLPFLSTGGSALLTACAAALQIALSATQPPPTARASALPPAPSGALRDVLQHEDVVRHLVDAVLVEPERAAAAGDQVRLRFRVPAREQRDVVALPDELLGQVGNDALGAAVVLGRHALEQRRNLGNSHPGS